MGLQTGQKRVSDLLELELQLVVKLSNVVAWVLGTELGPLQEQQVLLSVEPSLQPLKELFWFVCCVLDRISHCVASASKVLGSEASTTMPWPWVSCEQKKDAVG